MRQRRTTLLTLTATLALLGGCASERVHQREFANGRLQERGLLDGYKQVGMWTTWHEDGTLASEGRFVAGRQEGRWTYGHPGGEPAGVGHFRDGIQHGWWSARAADGRLLSAGLMLDGRRSGPWLVDGVLRAYGAVPSRSTIDTLAWRDGDRASVEWLVAAATIAVEARWQGEGSPWTERSSDPGPRSALASRLSPPAPGATATAGDPGAAPPAAPGEADLPPPLAVEATPLPPRIAYGAIVRGIAASIRSGFTGAVDAAAAATPPPAPPPPTGGDPAARELIGRPLPQTRFIASSGALIDLNAPSRPTVVIIMRGFSGSVCLYCASQTAALVDSAAAFSAAGIDVVVVYPGPASAIPTFLDAVQQLRGEKPPLPVALDVNRLLVSGLGIESDLAKPTSLILGRDGRIAWAYIGTSMSDRPSAAELLGAARAVR